MKILIRYVYQYQINIRISIWFLLIYYMECKLQWVFEESIKYHRQSISYNTYNNEG